MVMSEMAKTLAFDVYGTLIDTQGVVVELSLMIGDRAAAFSQTWRDKQLEYSFRRGLMQSYQPFSVCTRHALEYTCRFYGIDLSDEQKESLLDRYRHLPAFEEVIDGLSALKKDGHRLYAFSNGTAEAVEHLLINARIRDLFEGVVSVDDLQSFKPNPEVYHYFLSETDSTCDATWLISGNPFDVIGAMSVGMSAAWIQRSSNTVFDPWGVEPTLTVSGLNELKSCLSDV